jgi:large subunit ribosomal protein L21
MRIENDELRLAAFILCRTIDHAAGFPYNLSFSTGNGVKTRMSYAVIKTGGKQFAVTAGETLRVPTIAEDAGKKISIDALVLGEGKDAKLGGGATIDATIVGHGKDDKIIVFKKKRRKQYKRKQGHRQGFTEITMGEI